MAPGQTRIAAFVRHGLPAEVGKPRAFQAFCFVHQMPRLLGSIKAWKRLLEFGDPVKRDEQATRYSVARRSVWRPAL